MVEECASSSGLAALALAAPAGASNIATPRMAEVASWAAGRPIAVHCENDAGAWLALLASRGPMPPFIPDGFTNVAQPIVYIGPTACAYLGHTGPRLGIGLNTLLHEAAHQRGFVDEALAECAARVLIYSALHDFYAVPWYSNRMRDTTQTALDYSLTKPPDYQRGCDRLGG